MLYRVLYNQKGFIVTNSDYFWKRYLVNTRLTMTGTKTFGFKEKLILVSVKDPLFCVMRLESVAINSE